MNSLSVILAIVLFLSSGLAAYAGFFIFGGSSQFNAAPPRPSSITSLTVVVLGSVLTHALAAFAFELCDVPADTAIFTFDHSPNPYVLAVELALGQTDISGSSTSYVMLWTAIIPCLSMILAWIAATRLLKLRSVASFVYGWMEPIVREAAPDENWVVAFVVTKIALGNELVGYEGTVKEVTMDPDKQMTSISLEDVERFLLGKADRSLRRRSPTEEVPKIGNLHIPAERIENVAFTVFAIEDD